MLILWTIYNLDKVYSVSTNSHWGQWWPRAARTRKTWTQWWRSPAPSRSACPGGWTHASCHLTSRPYDSSSVDIPGHVVAHPHVSVDGLLLHAGLELLLHVRRHLDSWTGQWLDVVTGCAELCCVAKVSHSPTVLRIFIIHEQQFCFAPRLLYFLIANCRTTINLSGHYG